MVQWTIWALPGLIAAVLSVALAVFVWRVDPARVQNRRVAFIVAASGLAMGAGHGLRLLASDPSSAFAAFHLSVVFVTLLPFLLVRLLQTLDSPLAVALRVPAVEGLFGIIGATLALVLIVEPSLAATQVKRLAFLHSHDVLPGFVASMAQALYLAVAAYGWLLAASAVRHAPDRAARAQARGYAVAFGALAVLLALLAARAAIPVALLWTTETSAGSIARILVPTLGQILVAALLTRAVIMSQLLDVTVRARDFVSRSAIVGVFTFTVVVGGEVLERLIPAPGLVLGIGAAVLLGLLLHPIQRLANRLAQRLVPDESGGTDATPFGADEVYRSAFVGAFGDGDINDKEMRTLDTLRHQLGVSKASARRIEAEARRELQSRRKVA